PSEHQQSALVGHLSAALNGLIGDHLEETGNPIAFTMQLQHKAQSLILETEKITHQVANPGSKIVVLIHGLCMSDAQWQRDGASHADGLESDLNYTPLYLRYNSGKHISQNGRELAQCLEKLLENWPVDVEEISLVTHSMGGLVARSACHYGAQSKWISKMCKVVFLGTPHHGAPLERKSNWLETLWSVIPYSAALARLGMARSSGITDLRYGIIVDEDWQCFDRFKRRQGPEHIIPLPRDVKCYAAASTIGLDRGDLQDKLLGDGLVPVSSALGEHTKQEMSLNIARENQSITYAMNHFDLLYRPEIHEQVLQWLAE
ncbi:triacylglycerol lipase, partial [Oleiphilus sp. HI0067]|uniref:esterase/lipase family protein n=1 Tax=Oleiphilus sp. HI0067 TaxID=1822243 RepID=UPI000B074FCE